jgi:hypothetical protein
LLPITFSFFNLNVVDWSVGTSRTKSLSLAVTAINPFAEILIEEMVKDSAAVPTWYEYLGVGAITDCVIGNP